MTITISPQHADRFSLGDRILFAPHRTWLARLWRWITRKREHVWVVSSITEVDRAGRTVTIGTPPGVN